MDTLAKLVKDFVSKIASSKEPEQTPKECYLLQLPPELLQIITEYLSSRDLSSLGRTCQAFYRLMNEDQFWIHLIRARVPPAMTSFYTYDVFQEPTILPTNDQPRPTGFMNSRSDSDLDRSAADSATHYNDDAVQQRQGKMFVSKENFRKCVQYFQFGKPRNNQTIPLMKLVYFYLIDRKRTAIVDMHVTHRNDQYLIERSDRNSFKGRIIYLNNVCWLEITGQFPRPILPGKYQVIWRMKTNGGYISVVGETEFIVVPTHGRLLNHKISEQDFRDYAIRYGQHWFSVNTGEILIYEPSTVHVAIRNWANGNWKSGIAWDCVELKIVS